MDARISAASSNDRDVDLCHVSEGNFDRGLDCWLIRLALPAGVGGAVVLDRQLEGGHGRRGAGCQTESGWRRTAAWLFREHSLPLPCGSLMRIDEGFDPLEESFSDAGQEGIALHQLFLGGIGDES